MTHELLYCIQHEKMIDAEVSPDAGTVHIEIIGGLMEPDWDFCTGPFAYCPPPPDPDDAYFDWLFANEDEITEFLEWCRLMDEFGVGK